MAKLTAKARNKMPNSTFAVPSKRAYPEPDESHARNALARSSGKPEHAAVVRKTKQKFPGIKIGHASGGFMETDDGPQPPKKPVVVKPDKGHKAGGYMAGGGVAGTSSYDGAKSGGKVKP